MLQKVRDYVYVCNDNCGYRIREFKYFKAVRHTNSIKKKRWFKKYPIKKNDKEAEFNLVMEGFAKSVSGSVSISKITTAYCDADGVPIQLESIRKLLVKYHLRDLVHKHPEKTQ